MSQARTNIGPLTTTFTPPPACNTAYIPAASIATGSLGVHCPTPLTNTFNNATYATTCYPPASRGAPAPSYPISGWGFYSPGLICPAGFSSACSATAGGETGWAIQFTMTQGETAVGCCPTGFYCAHPDAQSCTRMATSGDVVTVSKCPSQAFKETITLPGTITGSATQEAVDSMYLQAPMIEIVWKSTDRPSSNSSPNPTNSPSSSHTSGSSSNSSSLSTGEKAAIGVVVPVVIIALLVGLLIFFRRRHKSSQRAEAYEPSRHTPVAGNSHGYARQSKNPQELSTNANRHELGSREQIYKTPGDSPASRVYEAEDTSPNIRT